MRWCEVLLKDIHGRLVSWHCAAWPSSLWNMNMDFLPEKSALGVSEQVLINCFKSSSCSESVLRGRQMTLLTIANIGVRRGGRGERKIEFSSSSLTQPLLVSLITDANDYFLHLGCIRKKILSYLAAKVRTMTTWCMASLAARYENE